MTDARRRPGIAGGAHDLPSARPKAMRAGRVDRGALASCAIMAILLTTGCISFQEKAPKRLLTVMPEALVEPAEAVSGPFGEALFVDEPAAPRAIATTRVAVRSSETSITYVNDAVWTDTPANQFQALLAETIRLRTGKLVLDPEQYLARRGEMLEGTLRAFGLDAVKKQAIVAYDASLMSADGKTILAQRFSASVPVEKKIDADSVRAPISQAATRVADQVADWLKTAKRPTASGGETSAITANPTR